MQPILLTNDSGGLNEAAVYSKNQSQTEMQPTLLTNDSGGLNEAAVHSQTDTQQALFTNLRTERSEFHNSIDQERVFRLSNN